MKFKFNPLTGEFNLVPDSGTLKQKLNWLTGNFNLTKDAGKYKQIYNAIEGEFNLRPAVTQVIVHGVGSIQLTNAVENGLLSLKAFGGTEQRILPSEYTQLEYITFDGQSFIDTDYTVSLDDEIQTKVKFTSVGFIYGASTSVPRITLYGSPGGNQRWGDKYVSTNGVPAANTDLVIKHNKDALIINDTTMAYASQEDFTTAETLTIGNDNGNTTTAFFSGNLYYFKFFKDGVLVRDYIPAKDSNNVVGLFDRVSGTFFTNDGTGTLTAGPNAVPTPEVPMDIISNNGVLKARHQSGLPIGYTQVEYLRSGGTQYIDLGYKGNGNTKVDVKFKYYQTTATSGSGRVFGSRNAAAVDAFAIGSASGTASTNSTIAFFFGNQSYLVTEKSLVLDEWLNVTFDKTIHNINGVDYGTPYNDETFETPQNLKLFGFDNSGTLGIGYVDIAYCKLWNNGVLVRDLIPCKNSSNVFGMYDLVTGNFLTNDGTGDFSAGNAVSDPVGIYVEGTTETIGIHGKNLFNKNHLPERITAYFSGSGTTWTYTSAGYSLRFPCLPNTTYTARYNGSSTQAVLSFASTSNDKVPSSEPGQGTVTVTQAIRQNSPTIDTPVTLTTGANDKWLIVQYNVADPQNTDMANNLQIELGPTATTYEPYFDGGTATAEMLLKIDDYVDEQEILSGAVTRKIGVYVFNGTETFINGQNGWITENAITDQIKKDYYPYCTHFKGTNDTPAANSNTIRVYRTSSNTARVYFGINKSIYTSTTVFQQRIADQYNAGTPVIVVYVLDTPTTETVEGQTMNIQAGSNTIEITQASLDNLELEATYEQEA